MHTVTIFNLTPDDAIKLKNQLLRDGLIMNQDFNWEYQPMKWDNFSYDPTLDRRAVFTFDKGPWHHFIN
jgi:hypothetical protein